MTEILTGRFVGEIDGACYYVYQAKLWRVIEESNESGSEWKIERVYPQ